MRPIILSFLLLCLASVAGAQHYFNRVYTVHAYNSMIVGIVPKGSGYLTTCMVLDSSRGPNTAQDMMTLDSAGNVVYDSLVYNDTLIVYPGSNAFMRLPDGRFAMVPTNCKGFTGLRHIMPRFFDSTGKLLWDTTYNKMFCPEFAYWNIYDMKPLPWGGWLVLSNIACYDASIFTHNQNDICLTKLDEHFNVLWHRQIGHPKLNDEGRKLLIEPGVYTIGGLSNASSLYGAADIRNNFRCQIIQTDTDGNILHVWKSDTSKQSFCIRDLIRTRDGGYVYCGSGNGYKTLHFPDGTVADFYYKGWVAKLDSNFNMLWYDSVGLAYSLAPPEVTNVLELADGSIVVGGRLYGGTNGIDSVIDYDHEFTCINKYTADGHRIWARKYYRAGEIKLGYTVYDLRATADGGFIMAGQVTDLGQEYYDVSWMGWAIKVDSAGCMYPDDPQCRATYVAHTVLQPPTMEVYPNPFSRELTISCPPDITGWQFSLTDFTGRVQLQYSGRNAEERINLQHLLPGLYFYQFTSNGQTFKRGTIVKTGG